MALSPRLPASSTIYPDLTSPSQTRLVTFHETRDDGDFEAHVDVVDLDDEDRVSFQALSYLCGDPTPRSKVHLAGTYTHVEIAQNLTDAIRRLLRDGHRGPIWIDAISINQDDIAERNLQVRLMTHIYRGASEVVAWLGLDLPDCRHTIDILSRWAYPFGVGQLNDRALDEYNDTGTLSTGVDNDGLMSYLLQLCKIMTAADWTALRAFYDVPYFGRSWVIQEVVSGTKLRLLLGASGEVYWSFVYFASLWLVVAHRHASAAARALDRRMPLLTNAAILTSLRLTQYDADLSLSKLPEIFHYQSTDPRDKFFSITGIFDIPKSVQHHFEVDYNRATWLVFAEAVRGHIKFTQKLEFLTFEDELSCTTVDFPSWVPSSEGTEPSRLRFVNKGLTDFDASTLPTPHDATCSQAEIRDADQTPEILTLLGVACVGTITQMFQLHQKKQRLAVFGVSPVARRLRAS